MNTSWKDMNTSQKIEAILTIVMGLIVTVLCVLDLTGKWPNNYFHLALAALSLVEAYFGWNRNRKLAILELVAAAFFVANAFI